MITHGRHLWDNFYDEYLGHYYSAFILTWTGTISHLTRSESDAIAVELHQSNTMALILLVHAPPGCRRLRQMLFDRAQPYAPLFAQADAIFITEGYNRVDMRMGLFQWDADGNGHYPSNVWFTDSDSRGVASLLASEDLPAIVFDRSPESIRRMVGEHYESFGVLSWIDGVLNHSPPGFFWSSDPRDWLDYARWYEEFWLLEVPIQVRNTTAREQYFGSERSRS